MPETSGTPNSTDAHDDAHDSDDVHDDAVGDNSNTDHPTGKTQAAVNAENEPAG